MEKSLLEKYRSKPIYKKKKNDTKNNPSPQFTT